MSRSPTLHIGCVSYLNALPLIDGVEAIAQRLGLEARVRYAVPAQLPAMLREGRVDVALCPVIDTDAGPRARAEAHALRRLDAGGIGCDGPTHTVRLFADRPFERIDTVAADTHSHSSVALLRVIRHLAGLPPLNVRPLDPGAADTAPCPSAVLLIGDKVITSPLARRHWACQIDLGQAWQEHTGLPFVFAAWTIRQDTPGDLARPIAELLAATRQANHDRRDQLARTHAGRFGWPTDQAVTYLTRTLCYEIGPRQHEAIDRFLTLARDTAREEAENADADTADTADARGFSADTPPIPHRSAAV